MNYEIKKIIDKDIDEIYKLGCNVEDFTADGGENCFWPKATLSKIVQFENDVTLKLVVNKKIVGFSLVMIHHLTQKAIIENFYILKEYKELEQEFFNAVEEAIKEKGAQFIAYFYDTLEDCNDKELFEKNNYFQGNAHYWMHKNISFSNPPPRKFNLKKK